MRLTVTEKEATEWGMVLIVQHFKVDEETLKGSAARIGDILTCQTGTQTVGQVKLSPHRAADPYLPSFAAWSLAARWRSIMCSTSYRAAAPMIRALNRPDCV